MFSAVVQHRSIFYPFVGDRIALMSLRGLSIDGPDRSNYVPYQAQWKLYIMHVFFAFTSRMWDMGIVFLIAELTNNSLSLVAMAGLMNNIFIILFMSRLGTFLDTTNRLRAAEIALSVKLLTLTIAYGVCAYLAHESHDPAHNSLVYLLPFLCAIASLSFSTISQSVEKDWIVVLSAGDSAWLSTTNSIMTQIDSGVNSFAPAATGYLFLTTSPTIAAIILLTINALSTLGLYFFLGNLYVSWPALAHRSSHESKAVVGLVDEKTVPSTFSPAPARAQCGCNWATDYADFFASGCAGAMISYACLYLTVLNFGSLMTVYLRWAGVSDGWIGLGRGAAAFTALCGAVAFPFINAWLGLYVTSAVAIVYQCVLVTAAAASFYLFPPHVTVFVLVVAVVSLLFLSLLSVSYHPYPLSSPCNICAV